ncbi:MAG: M28 family peptidase [Armatimonadetes bacterium]|nr:M28 family peptidase [Armatimonadota bacterium]
MRLNARWASAVVLVLVASAAIAGARAMAPTAPPSFDGQRAYADLVRQCDFGPRVPGTDAHEQCGAWLVQTLSRCADTVDTQRFLAKVGGRQLPLSNIVAIFNPGGDRHVLLCAHWDTRPTADCDPNPEYRKTPISGANDGASGVAVLLEIARALKASPPQQRVTVLLFDGEDYGPGPEHMFLGSRYYAGKFSGPKVDWAVLLDMVGDRDLKIPQEPISRTRAPEVVERIWEAAEQVEATAFVNTSGQAVIDDHVFLLQHGIPCIDVIDFEYPYWHTLADTPDKCAPDSLEQVGRTILAALAGDRD